MAKGMCEEGSIAWRRRWLPGEPLWIDGALPRTEGPEGPWQPHGHGRPRGHDGP